MEMKTEIKLLPNGKSLLMGYENHPLKDKIIKAFMEF